MKFLLTILIGYVFLVNGAYASEETVILRVESDSLSAATLEQMIETCTGSQDMLSLKRVSARKNDQFEIVLRDGFIKESNCERERLFAYFITSVLPKNEPLDLRIVNGSPSVLIGDIRHQTIDLKDVMAFNNSGETGVVPLCAGQILFHELYELHHLIHVQGVQPRKASEGQLAWAHAHATQKESNLYQDNVEKVESRILGNSVFIKFSSRLNSDYSIYHAYHRNGNVYRVDASSGSD